MHHIEQRGKDISQKGGSLEEVVHSKARESNVVCVYIMLNLIATAVKATLF